MFLKILRTGAFALLALIILLTGLVVSGRNKRLNIPPFVLSDGPRGAVVGKGNTSFPVAMARGASWDVNLERRVGDVIARELRANKTNYLAAPCINLLRHPAWGRAQETYGEDPWLLGEMGLALVLVEGVQQHNVMACAKHFAANSIENSRFYLDVNMDERTLREVYLPHFKKVVQKGNIASLMSSYNKFRGDYCGHSHYLLTGILRDEWGFEGFISSDWIWGLRNGVKGINAGMDVEMPARRYYSKRDIRPALDRGEITMEQIDEMVLRVLRTKLLFAFREDIMDYDAGLKAGDMHTDFAREVAGKSMVLLKNEQVLPFDIRQTANIAVIGRLADVENTGDRKGDEIVQLYIGFSGSSARRPVKLLRSFERAQLLPGETRTVTLSVPSEELAMYDPGIREWVIENMSYEVYIGGSSCRDDLLQGHFEYR